MKEGVKFRGYRTQGTVHHIRHKIALSPNSSVEGVFLVEEVEDADESCRNAPVLLWQTSE